MADDSWPSPAHNSRGITDVEYEQIACRFSDNGVYGSPADAAVVSAGTGLTVTIRPDVYASVRGHAWYSGSSTVTLPIAPNASGQERRDRIVLRLDRATWTVRAVVRQGASSMTPDPVQQTGGTGIFEIPLAVVSIQSGAGTVTVTRSELYAGARSRPCTSKTLNPNPVAGELAVETDTGRVRIWTGSTWVLIYESSATISVDKPVSNWSIDSSSMLEVRSGTVHLRLGRFTRTAAALAGATSSRLPVFIPSDYQHRSLDQYGIAYLTGVRIARVTVFSAASDTPGQVLLTNHPTIDKDELVLPGGMSWAVSS
ncbi:hypothetical protein JK361_25880 [Streptomyces sp. 5-8]|uniref:Uncharacterized protein n=1 Tax=Streptomyces musisoli TaxID=2802280 RepID=A0ABS1P7E2_9ACTN|nr:hypothetical protein [Streptomyces musisoli]MBL1107977.1 hypothetical protein [Streptomyces musisoli]